MALIGKLTAIANAIRDKTGKSNSFTLDQMVVEIENIEIGIDTFEATATASDILKGKIAYVKGEEVVGNIETKSSSDLTSSGATVTVPAGYYASNTSKSVSTATQATPSISVSSAGVITASVAQTAGYISAGTKSATEELTTKAATTYIPSTSNQTIASGTYLTGTQTISGDSDLVAGNIKNGVTIFNVTGSYTGEGFITVHTGTSSPSSSVGSNGDIYLVV